MSIFIAIADSTDPQISGLVIPIAAALALAAAVAIGVFRPRTILGPQRLSPEESPRVLIGTIGIAVAAWAICLFSLGVLHQRLLQMRHEPLTSPFSGAETVVYGIIIDGAAFAAALAVSTIRPEGTRR